MDFVTAARLIAVPAALFNAGYGISASQSSIPIIVDQPASVSTPAFAQVYYRGLNFIAPNIVLSGVSSAYLAYALPQQRILWGAASALILAVPAFTGLLMAPGINRLIHLSENTAEREKAEATGEVVQKLKAWQAQNWVRVAMGVTSGMLGLWNVMQGGPALR